jgi:hypothetical protein
MGTHIVDNIKTQWLREKDAPLLKMTPLDDSEQEDPAPSSYVFGPSQQVYLREKLEHYTLLTGKQQNKYAKEVSTHLCKDVEKHSRQPLAKEQRDELRAVSCDCVVTDSDTAAETHIGGQSVVQALFQPSQAGKGSMDR